MAADDSLDTASREQTLDRATIDCRFALPYRNTYQWKCPFPDNLPEKCPKKEVGCEYWGKFFIIEKQYHECKEELEKITSKITERPLVY